MSWSPRQSSVKETTRNLASPIAENQEIRMLAPTSVHVLGSSDTPLLPKLISELIIRKVFFFFKSTVS